MATATKKTATAPAATRKTPARKTGPAKKVARKSAPVKAAKPVSTAPIAVAAAAPVEAHKPKNKPVRDSFTMPKSEYAVLEQLKKRASRLDRPIKKSEVLRAGVAALERMKDADFVAALDGVAKLKTGRPKVA